MALVGLWLLHSVWRKEGPQKTPTGRSSLSPVRAEERKPEPIGTSAPPFRLPLSPARTDEQVRKKSPAVGEQNSFLRILARSLNRLGRKGWQTDPEPAEKNPFLHTLLLSRLDKLASEGAYEQAIQLFGKEPLFKPRASDELATHASILRIMGRCYEAQSDWQKAKECYQKAVDYSGQIGYHPHEQEAGIARCNQQLGDQASGTIHYERGEANGPNDPGWQPSRAAM